MKTVIVYVGLCMPAFSASACAQASLPDGNYEITGTVTSISGSACPFARNRPVTGHIYYPGIGRETTQLVLQSTDPGKSITVAFLFAFPPVPAAGLNGWSGSSSVSPNYNQYRNGLLTGGGTAAILGFTLDTPAGTPLAFTQGTLSLQVDSIGPCAETVQAVFTRIAPFRQ